MVLYIWFPEAAGSVIDGAINKESPPIMVWFIGWFVFLLPLGILGYWWLAGVFQ